ncbi:hypothetical protein JAAARDRAFT_37996 [Jaapia argillacea MUCL 33604]|uniref:Kinesin motor domain-containing protein n=1 Tax=Jaapia argillacea MUCL 33604 TaxID=933084 RepID=A0A067PIZ8_9AGAM|nr:hypothetical protein JAAARDRAFT_37996 [Jaapia argillacea MUCL 33604]
MATRNKPTTSALPTRASSRTKTPAVPTTRSTRAAAKSAAPPPVAPIAAPTKKAAATKKAPADRKPLHNRNASPDVVAAQPTHAVDADREPIKAYLRIRPYTGTDPQPDIPPYLLPLSQSQVRMTDPSSSSHPSQQRSSTTLPSSIYTFSHIFPPTTPQSSFFTHTTLPLINDLLLEGRNGLIFAYGVTNSGKTFTVQGGKGEGQAGILPRALDVIFNSIEGLHADNRYRPVRLQGVEPIPPTPNSSSPIPTTIPTLASVLDPSLSTDQDADLEQDIDPTILSLDRNYEYSVWLSYVEVYNEKVYDLLASYSATPTGGSAKGHANQPLLVTRKALTLKSSPPGDSPDSPGGPSPGKYISTALQIRVNSAHEAKSLLTQGQLHRRVFGTVANRESSRSHAIVQLKVLRCHKGERDDPTSIQTTRLTLVDLAGSERTKHTQTTGDRLKEAGNINKSLMVLGQCMEVMKSNQMRLAQSLRGDQNQNQHEVGVGEGGVGRVGGKGGESRIARPVWGGGAGAGGRMDTREVKKGLAVVPFRHSKLTEILMDYFVGEGRAVMIVNVNPYDTGYDENSHVMKFAAIAREVCTNALPAPVHRLPPPAGDGKKGKGKKEVVVEEVVKVKEQRRKVTISMGGGGRKSETMLEVVEEDEEPGDGDEGDDYDGMDNPLVDALFEEIDALRMQLFESEMRCALIEAETREEVTKEMEDRMRDMERMFARRLMNEVEQSEIKTDAKIDLLHKSGLFGKSTGKAKGLMPPPPPPIVIEEEEEESEIEVDMSLRDDRDTDDEIESESDGRRPSSPLAGKSKGKKKQSIAPIPIVEDVPDDGEVSMMLPPEFDGDEEPDAEDDETQDGDELIDDEAEESDGEEEEEEESEEVEDEDETETDDDWQPEPVVKGTAKTSKPAGGSKATSTFRRRVVSDEDEDEDEDASLHSSPPLPKKPTGSKGKAGTAKTQTRPALPLWDSSDDEISVVPKGKGKESQRASSHKKVSSIEDQFDELSLDDSVMIIPDKKARQNAVVRGAPEVEYVPQVGEGDTGKKKKRVLGAKTAFSVDQIERLTMAAEKEVDKPVRRTTRGMK